MSLEALRTSLTLCKADRRAFSEQPKGTRYISMGLTPRFCTVEISRALTTFHSLPGYHPFMFAASNKISHKPRYKRHHLSWSLRLQKQPQNANGCSLQQPR